MFKISLVILSSISFSLAHAERQYGDDDIQRISPASERDRAEKCKQALDNKRKKSIEKLNRQMGGFYGPTKQYTEKIDDRQMGGVPESDPYNRQQH